MQALEAMQRLTNIGKLYVESFPGETQEEQQFAEDTGEAIKKIEQMLDLALPIARFRCHVEVDYGSKTRGKIRDEFTICSPTIYGVFGGLIGLSRTRTDVRVTLWEQSIEKAEMVSGYQGPSKAIRYGRWLEEINELYAPPAIPSESTN